MNKRMALPANIDAILFHFGSGEVFFKPFVGMARLGYQMMERQSIRASA
ncbi:MAG: hypothetical protein MJE63_13690 [Proteobacteria bacterium]|nr:hypothetical protein [Pseudomonadota bacterium]